LPSRPSHPAIVKGATIKKTIVIKGFRIFYLSFLEKSGDNNKLIKLLGQEVFEMKNEIIRLREGEPDTLKKVDNL